MTTGPVGLPVGEPPAGSTLTAILSASCSERQIIGTRQDASVTESNAAIYIENSVQWRDWLRTVVGLREDQFDFDVRDKNAQCRRHLHCRE